MSTARGTPASADPHHARNAPEGSPGVPSGPPLEAGGPGCHVPGATPGRGRSGLATPQTRILAILVTAVVLLLAAAGMREGLGAAIASAVRTSGSTPGSSTPLTGPTPTLPPPGSYQWSPGPTPITWRCSPIRYRIVEAGSPPGAARLVAEALRRFSDASSGTFTFTPTEPITDWPGDSDDWHGITIGWADSAEFEWSGNSLGRAHTSSIGRRIANAHIRLRTQERGDDRLTKAQKAAVIQQELGHAVGLGHADQDTVSIMTPVLSATTWSPTDRQALTYLGWYSCRN